MPGTLLLGVGVIALAGAAVYFAVDDHANRRSASSIDSTCRQARLDLVSFNAEYG
jgi:L-ribulose-5-phosphate 3-epimerase UlaE